MTLVDAGPLVAILDQDERDHARCVEALATLSSPLLTTWPALTEAMYLLGEADGWRAQEYLWRLVEREDLRVSDLDDETRSRAHVLMEKYRDLPMDLADATLVALAESMNLRRIFTLDGDFRVYRFKGKGEFDIVP